VTVWSPGCTVSSVSSESRSVTVIATVALSPALSVPDIGVTFSLSRSQAGSEIDHATGPSLAVSVSRPPCHGLSTTVVGDTDSVPVADEPDQVTAGVGQYVAVAAGDVVSSLAVAGGDVPTLAVGEVDAPAADQLPPVAGSVVGGSVLPLGGPLGTLDSAIGAAAGTVCVGPPPGGCAGGMCGRTAVTTATAAAVTAVPPATVIGTCGRCRMFR